MSCPEIENLPWGEPKSVLVSGAPKLVKSAEPNDTFWNLWRSQKHCLKMAGISVGKWGGKFAVNWWEPFKLPSFDDVPVIPEIELPPVEPLKFPYGLLEYQPPFVATIVRAMGEFNASLNGCGTGIGKTFITLGAIRERGRRALVICPKVITEDWERAARSMGVTLAGVYGWEWMKTEKTPFLKWNTRQVKKKMKDGSYVLVNKKDHLFWEVPNDVDVVFDECHRAANEGTQNQKMVITAVEARLPIFGLSATIADVPTKLRAMGYALGLHRNGKDWYDWLIQHGVVQTRFGMQFQGGERHLKAIHKQIFPHKGIRVRAEQIKNFPKNQTIAKAYKLDEANKINSVYADMMARVAELECSDMAGGDKQACILVEILRARQAVELLKIPLMVSLTEDAIEEGNSVFLAVNFRDTLKELIARLGIKSIIMGGQKPEIRRSMIDEFQANKTNVIAGIIKACREGLNLHDIHGGHPRESLIMPPPSSFDLKQTLGRVWRAGGLTPSLQRILFASGTIEEDVCESLANKLDQLDLLMDGDLQKGIFPPSYSAYRPQIEAEADELESNPF